MGEYARLNDMLRDEKESLAKLQDVLEHFDELPKNGRVTTREDVLELIMDKQIGIGEIEGALLEMADVDGLDDPYEAFDY